MFVVIECFAKLSKTNLLAPWSVYLFVVTSFCTIRVNLGFSLMGSGFLSLAMTSQVFKLRNADNCRGNFSNRVLDFSLFTLDSVMMELLSFNLQSIPLILLENSCNSTSAARRSAINEFLFAKS